ncbi:hypothetical protein H8E07_22520 [bacterium]|nr:hypothetical protein [bacterium]
MNWKWLALLGCVLCTMASTTTAQEPDLDLVLADVQVLVFPDKSSTFQLRPMVNVWNRGNLLSHAIDVAQTYGPVAQQLINDTVTYIQQEHSCWWQPITNCGGGTCLDIMSIYYGSAEGTCASGGFLMHCGCLYSIEYELPETTFVPGYTTVTVAVDPFNLVPETDETNNTMTIDLGPIANDFETWSSIKSMYR